MSDEKEKIGIPALLEAGKKVVVTEADIVALHERLYEADKELKAEARSAASDEFLNRQYTI